MPALNAAFGDVWTAVRGIFSSLLNNLVAAALILLIGFIVGRMVGKLLQRLLHEMELDKFLRLTVGISLSVEHLVSSLLSYIIYFVSVVMALDKLGLNTVLFSIIAVGVIAVLIISLLLALRDFIPNVFSGLFIHYRGLIKVGDVIRLDRVEGKVIAVNLAETKLETRKGDIIFVPNGVVMRKDLFKKKQRSSTSRGG